MNFCYSCQRSISDHSEKCPQCGKSIDVQHSSYPSLNLLVGIAQRDSRFFRALVDNTDVALKEISEAANESIRAFTPTEALNALVGQSVGSEIKRSIGKVPCTFKNTCLTTCYDECLTRKTSGGGRTCNQTCLENSCGVTCSGLNSCDRTCSEQSCEHTCQPQASLATCEQTCNEKSCNDTCLGGLTCRNTCFQKYSSCFSTCDGSCNGTCRGSCSDTCLGGSCSQTCENNTCSSGNTSDCGVANTCSFGNTCAGLTDVDSQRHCLHTSGTELQKQMPSNTSNAQVNRRLYFQPIDRKRNNKQKNEG